MLLALCVAATAQERVFTEAVEKRDLTAIRAILAQKPAWLDREEWLARAVKDDPLLVSLLLQSGADARKPIPKFDGLSARDVAFASCNPAVMPILLGTLPDDTPANWRRPITDAGAAKRIIFEIGLAACRLRCRSINGTDRGPNCFSDEAMTQVSEQARYLLRRWGGAAWKPSPYDNALLSILSVLQSYAVRPEERTRHAAEEAITDFGEMMEDCRNGPSGAGRMIPIAVHTVAGAANQPNPGWQVFYKRKLFELDDTVEFELFPTLSSPATTKLPPGRYVVMARKGKLTTPPMTLKTTADSGEAAWFIPVNTAVEK